MDPVSLLLGLLLGLLLALAVAGPRLAAAREHRRQGAEARAALAERERERDEAHRRADAAQARLAEARERLERDAERLARAEERDGLGTALRPLGGGLARLEERLAALQGDRRSAEARLGETVRGLHEEVSRTARVADGLRDALRRPAVAGAWGELTLARVLELAGLPAGATVTEQPVLAGGALRPDVVVHLPGDRALAVDAKAPTDAWLAACAAEDEAARAAATAEHAGALRAHVDRLAARDYAAALPDGPAFVVLFLPAEALAAAALHHDPTLLEHAARRDVLVATPTTLIALLRAVAHLHGRAALAADAAAVAGEARELHARARTLLGHLAEVGTRLGQAGAAYDRCVGSAEARLLPGLRRLGDRAAPGAEPLPTPVPVALRPRRPRLPDAPAG